MLVLLQRDRPVWVASGGCLTQSSGFWRAPEVYSCGEQTGELLQWLRPRSQVPPLRDRQQWCRPAPAPDWGIGHVSLGAGA